LLKILRRLKLTFSLDEIRHSRKEAINWTMSHCWKIVTKIIIPPKIQLHTNKVPKKHHI
jgi:hypothetical protein